LQPISGDTRNARCGVCQVVLPAHHAGLCRHAQEPKHCRKFAERKSALKGACNVVDESNVFSQDFIGNNLVSYDKFQLLSQIMGTYCSFDYHAESL
jgi:hypothetical protein